MTRRVDAAPACLSGRRSANGHHGTGSDSSLSLRIQDVGPSKLCEAHKHRAFTRSSPAFVLERVHATYRCEACCEMASCDVYRHALGTSVGDAIPDSARDSTSVLLEAGGRTVRQVVARRARHRPRVVLTHGCGGILCVVVLGCVQR